jgi:hypothetical protein
MHPMHYRVATLGLATLSALTLWLSTAFATTDAQAPPPVSNGGDFSNETHPIKKVPPNTLIIKGAWASSSDSTTPVPEGGTITGNAYTNAYFGLNFTLPLDWTQKYEGPPPSDSGSYSLLQLTPPAIAEGPGGNVLITAQDLFFTPTGATNTQQLIRFARDHLQAVYQIEREPALVQLAGRSFIRYDYVAPVGGLHWRVLATQVRCHVVQFIFTSRDQKLIEKLVEQIGRMKLPSEAGLTSGTGGGDVPECVPDYAQDANILEREDPVFTERRYNPIPVRIIIDREGRVKHIHFLSAFPSETTTIKDALSHWRFKPYLSDGHPVEVETGIMFGRAPPRIEPPRPQRSALN